MIHEKDMSTTRVEFFRNLGIALTGLDHTIDDNHIVVGTGDKKVDLKLSALPPRILSQTVHMERWSLRIEFFQYSVTEEESFMKVFDRAFHRGGG